MKKKTNKERSGDYYEKNDQRDGACGIGIDRSIGTGKQS